MKKLLSVLLLLSISYFSFPEIATSANAVNLNQDDFTVGFITGVGAGLRKGKVDGYNQFTYNPSPLSNPFFGQMKSGYDEGYSAGYANGYTEGEQLKASGGKPPRLLDFPNEKY